MNTLHNELRMESFALLHNNSVSDINFGRIKFMHRIDRISHALQTLLP